MIYADEYKYRTSVLGLDWGFRGFYPGESPLELFDAGNWLACMHAVMVGVYVVNDVGRAWRVMSDDGALHELLHLACGIQICTHSSMAEIRMQIAEIEADLHQFMTLNDLRNAIARADG